MQSAKQLLSNPQQLTEQAQKTSPTSNNSGRASAELLEALTGMWEWCNRAWPGRWANHYGPAGGETFNSWAFILKSQSGDDIRRGFRRMRDKGSDFMPSAFAFLDLCKPIPEDFRLLSESDAFDLAVRWKQTRDENRRPEVLAALQMMDSHRFRSAKTEDARKLFATAYARVVIRVSNGGKLPEIPLQLGFKLPSKPVDKAKGHAALAELRAML